MRRILIGILSLALMVCLLVSAVSAQTCASSVHVYATVSSDGSCQVTVTALLHLEQATGQLYFPLPLEAENVTLNGTRVATKRTASSRQVDLSGIAGNLVGDFSVTMTYLLRDMVSYNESDILELELPLLAGFAYPVEFLEYSINLPGEVGSKPAFSSGYHKSNIEKDLTTQVTGSMIAGSANKSLKDHETLTMTVPVSETMFPQNRVELPDYDATNALMWVALVLAALYWSIFLRCRMPRRITVAAAPEGYCAGQMESILHLQGADLTMMVFSWAQLGYVYIRRNKHGRVLLYKRMSMGNERSSFEQKCFAALFGRRDVMDTSELRYVELWDKASKMEPNIQSLVHPKTGNKKIFRGLAALIGLFGGAGMGIAMGAGMAVQWLWVVLFALLGFLASWHIQLWSEGLLLYHKHRLWTGLALSVVWIVISAIAGVFSMGFWVVVSQVLAGLFATFGGRRTEAGMQAYAEVLGLRRYLRRVSREDLQRISQSNPEYFFSMIPYAMALGADKHFARRFGKLQLPECPYMDLGTDARFTVSGWRNCFRRMATEMDHRRKKMWAERLSGIFNSMKK